MNRTFSTRLRFVELLGRKLRGAKVSASSCRTRRSVHPWEAKVKATRFFQAANELAREGGDRVNRALGIRRVTTDECVIACDELLRSTVRTPFTTYLRAGLYTVELTAPHNNPRAPVLVLTHGYATGSGLWCFALDLLATHFKVYAVDWLGCGASERPPWRAGTTGAAEAFFLDSLEAWVSLTPEVAGAPFALVGHSLGGYLSAAYALRHPGRVASLTLLSPAGMSASAPASSPSDARHRAGVHNDAHAHPHLQQQLSDRQRRHWAVRALTRAWESGITPQAVVRVMGRWGEKWASRVLSQRFMAAAQRHEAQRQQDSAEQSDIASTVLSTPLDNNPAVGRALSNYLYAITAAPGSGEYALRRLLVFGGAHAHDPIAPRFLAAAAASPSAVPSTVTILYGGSHDWMPTGPGLALAARLRGLGVDSVAGVVPHSGHHLHMENPGDIAQVLRARSLATVSPTSQVGVPRPLLASQHAHNEPNQRVGKLA